MIICRHLRLSCLLIAGLLGSGCGGGDNPELGVVTGVVTIDGEPASNLIVMFAPENGRMATATTDSTGFYEVKHSDGLKGAKVGKCKVSLAWPTGAESGVPIPSRYSTKTELHFEVRRGVNEFPIEVELTPQERERARNTPATID